MSDPSTGDFLALQSFDLIVRHFDTEPEQIKALEELKTVLSGRIHELMQHNMGLLLSILYRIDVNETRLKMILEFGHATDIPNDLADLIIERQLQKIETRKQFSRDHGTL